MNGEHKIDGLNVLLRLLKESIMVFASCALLAMAVNLVYEPMGMVIGGITGLAITVRDMVLRFTEFDVSVSTLNLFLNIPILLCAIRMKGWRFFAWALYGTVVLSIMLAVIPIGAFFEDDLVFAAIAGGVLSGLSMGIIFFAGKSTGGTDLVATLLSMKSGRLPQSAALFIVDGLVVVLGLSVFGVYKSVYGLLSLMIMFKVCDMILTGFAFSKLVLVVSEKSAEIKTEILHEIKRGVTVLSGRGGYSGKGKEVLMCACERKETGRLVRKVNETDDKAFIVILSAKEILGEGFAEKSK